MRIEIETLSHDGRGVGRIDGKVAFVAGALPGETVDAVLLRRHRRFDEYRLVAVAEPAPERVAPPCPLVGRCGGCDLQHLAGDAQLEHKTGVVLDLLRRQAGLEPAALDEPLRSPPFGYRRRARLAVTVARRGGTVSVGFRIADDREVIDVDRCVVLVPVLQPLPGRLEELVGAFRDPRALGHLELMVSEAPDGAEHALVHVHAVRPLVPADRHALVALAEAERAYLSVRAPDALEWLHRPRAEPPGYRLPDFGLRLAFEPGDFLQGNGIVNRQLVRRVADWLGDPGGRSLLDAYCGLGNFSLPLARRGFAVTGVEVDRAMVARAEANAAANGIEHARFLAADLERAERLEAFAAGGRSHGVDLALLDPPRAGAATLVPALAARRLATILYVSCAPAALARDAAVLAEAGYALDRLALADMFPQTTHIEAMALFSLRPRRRRSAERSASRRRARATGT
ncbi:MAG TPA: methyltransferase domain-containing protein [Pseudomonadales bacterium]